MSSQGGLWVSRRAYSGAAQRGPLELWRPPLRSVDAELREDGETLRARARDLERNHPFARQAVRTSRLGVIGKKLRYSCRPDWRFLGIDEDHARHWAQEWERVWESYAHGQNALVDAGRRLNFTQMMGLAHDADVIDGEFLAVAEWDRARRWKSCWQLVDVDRLSTPDHATESRYLRQGVRLDALGAPVSYHIRGAHPHDYGVGMEHASEAFEWSEIPRETAWGRPICLHGYDHHRAGQTRGRTEFASVITAMKMGAEYVETALQQAVLQASYAAVLESTANYKEAMEAIGAGPEATEMGAGTVVELAAQQLEAAVAYHEQLEFRFGGSRVSKLFPGEKLELLTPKNSAGTLTEFQAQAARSYAAGLGVDPIGVSQDYSNVNYSSAKMSQATTHRGYGGKRQRLGDTIGLPMVGSALEEAVHAGDFPLPQGLDPADFYAAKDALTRGVFLSQGAPNLDPVKEAQALELRLRLGLTTLQDAAAAEGEDWEEILSQRAREQDRMAELGIGDFAFLPPSGGGAPGGAEAEG